MAGIALAQRLSGFRCQMIGIRRILSRRTASLEKVVGPLELFGMLAQPGVVVCSAVASAQTRHLFDASAFPACKAGPVSSMSPAVMVDADALLTVLNTAGPPRPGWTSSTPNRRPNYPYAQHLRVIATRQMGV